MRLLYMFILYFSLQWLLGFNKTLALSLDKQEEGSSVIKQIASLAATIRHWTKAHFLGLKIYLFLTF